LPTKEEILIVARHLDLLKTLNVHVPISEFDTLIAFHDKLNVFRIAEKLDLPSPATIVPESVSDISSIGNQYGYPVLLKLLHSSSAKGVFYLSKGNIEREMEDLMRIGSISYGSFIVQQFVSGTGYGVSLLLNQGKTRAIFTHRRIREKIYTGGPSAVRLSTKNDVLEAYAISLLASMKYHGVAIFSTFLFILIFQIKH
jgi:predicted ATP-grasp superfamily ATP-dependent carboligase